MGSYGIKQTKVVRGCGSKTQRSTEVSGQSVGANLGINEPNRGSNEPKWSEAVEANSGIK